MKVYDLEERAERITKYVVYAYAKFGKRRHFMVLEERGKPVLFEWQWQRKNIRGVTFELDDLEQAEAWVKRAMLAGYQVFTSSTKSGEWGGRGLGDWPLPWDWDDERGRWDLDAESVERRRRRNWDGGVR